MGEALITRRGGGGGGLDGFISGNFEMSFGGLLNGTTGNETVAYWRGQITCKRHGNEKTGYICWGHPDTWNLTTPHIALVDWENKTVTQLVTSKPYGSYPYYPQYGCNFTRTEGQCSLAVNSSEWDGENIYVVYLCEP